jgi:hypothetical protein
MTHYSGPDDSAEWLIWAADIYQQAVARGGCYEPEPDWNVEVISPRLREAAAEIERLRARVAVLERVREAALPHLFTPSMETGIALLKAVQEAKL